MGSGPAQSALAILADFTEDDALALRLYQEFKRAWVAPCRADNAFFEGRDIRRWLERRGPR